MGGKTINRLPMNQCSHRASNEKWTLFTADLGRLFGCLRALVFSYICRYDDFCWRGWGLMLGSFSWCKDILCPWGRVVSKSLTIGLAEGKFTRGLVAGKLFARSRVVGRLSSCGRAFIGGRELSRFSCSSIRMACLNLTSLTMDRISSCALIYSADSSSSLWS